MDISTENNDELEAVIKDIYQESYTDYNISADYEDKVGSSTGHWNSSYLNVGAWHRQEPKRYTEKLVDYTMQLLENRGHLMYNSPEIKYTQETPIGALGAIDLSKKEVYMDFYSLINYIGVENTLGVYKHEVYLHGNCGFTNDPAIYLLEAAFDKYGL